MRELSLHIMDVVQNSIAAEATLITTRVIEDTVPGQLLITVEDNGRGMTQEQLQKVQSPFYTTRTTRPVGLGVPLFKMAAEMTGGSFSICSEPGSGTTVSAGFVTGHIDMIPLGDIDQTILLLITCNPAIDFVFRQQRGGAGFTLDTRELRTALGEEVALNNPQVTAWLREYLAEQSAVLKGGS